MALGGRIVIDHHGKLYLGTVEQYLRACQAECREINLPPVGLTPISQGELEMLQYLPLRAPNARIP